MSKFTPGPWKATECMSHGTSVKAIASVAWCGTSTSFGKDGNQHIDSAEAYANALLIADAPALLDALESLIQHTNLPAHDSDVINARALIAKHMGDS